MQNRAHDGRGGFTLVELLVVIGIIALLISILLPALNKARSSALAVQCQANLRTIGQAMAVYTGGNKGTLPFGYGDLQIDENNGASLSAGHRYVNWGSLLIHTMDPKYSEESSGASQGTNTANLRRALLCPELFNSSINSYEISVIHYLVHPRLVPRIDWDNNHDKYKEHVTPGQTIRLHPYRVSRIEHNSEMVLAFDGSLWIEPGNVPGTTTPIDYYTARDHVPVADLSDNGMSNSAPWYTNDLKGSGVQTANIAKLAGDTPVDLTPWKSSGSQPAQYFNTDTDFNQHNVRFRHRKNTVMNALFCDGHVGEFVLSKQVPAGRTTVGSNLLRRNFLVNP